MQCDHNGLDAGPCQHVDPAVCFDCCLKCNRKYLVWHKSDPGNAETFTAKNAVEARYKGFLALRKANPDTNFIDIRTRRITKV